MTTGLRWGEAFVERPPRPTAGDCATVPKGEAGGRIPGIDSLRGLAIATMVAANAGAVILREPHPFGFRLAGSFAAPLFVTLAGMMAARATCADRSSRDAGGGRQHDLRYYLARGTWIVLAAIGMDIGVGHTIPLVTFDVLYIIGLSLPVAYLMARFAPPWARQLAPIAVFAATPLMQSCLGYDLTMDDVRLSTPMNELPPLLPISTRRFLVDGWFPLFPWMGFALLGVAMARPIPAGMAGTRPSRWLGATALVVGALIWWMAPGSMAVRLGYSELFYPPTPGFLFTATGVVLVLISQAEGWSHGPLVWLLQPLGRCPLLLYIVHLLVIDQFLKSRTPDLKLGPFLTVYVVFLALLRLLAVGVDRLKCTCRAHGIRLPLPLTILLGG